MHRDSGNGNGKEKVERLWREKQSGKIEKLEIEVEHVNETTKKSMYALKQCVHTAHQERAKWKKYRCLEFLV